VLFRSFNTVSLHMAGYIMKLHWVAIVATGTK